MLALMAFQGSPPVIEWWKWKEHLWRVNRDFKALYELAFHTKFMSEPESNFQENRFSWVVWDPACSRGCLNLRSGVHAVFVQRKHCFLQDLAKSTYESNAPDKIMDSAVVSVHLWGGVSRPQRWGLGNRTPLPRAPEPSDQRVTKWACCHLQHMILSIDMIYF